MIKNGLFTSESVSDGHPDKICDQISDAILDACLEQDPMSRVAIEAAIKNKTLFLLGEITSNAVIEPAEIARSVLREIGHEDERWGVEVSTLRVIEEIHQQSAEIGASVDGQETGAGDQGIMFGYAHAGLLNMMPLPIALAHALMERHLAFRTLSVGETIGPDAKAQVTFKFKDGRPVGLDTVVFSTQHAPDVTLDAVRELVYTHILSPVLQELLTPLVKVHINPAGSFTMGGPIADAGLTGRKIIVDSYGGAARHGGGAFSGKDATKVDRSGAYAARQLARDVLKRGWAKTCEARVAYAIGISKPVDISFETFGTETDGSVSNRYQKEGIDVAALMTPSSILHRLKLDRPIYRTTSNFGHFGHAGFTWEQRTLIEDKEGRDQSSLIISKDQPITSVVRRYKLSISTEEDNERLKTLLTMERLLLASYGEAGLSQMWKTSLEGMCKAHPYFGRHIRLEIINGLNI